MGIYKHILAAIELHDEGEQVLARAQQLARMFGARLSVIHVVEYLPVDPAGDALLTAPIDLSQERAEQARARIGEWCDKLGLDSGAVQVVIGAITTEILRAQEAAGADLVCIGHHSRRGLAALFSHTDDGVLQKARCDVLAMFLS